MGSPSDNVVKLKHVEFHEFYDTAALIAAAKP
jgi:hypothetical protein